MCGDRAQAYDLLILRSPQLSFIRLDHTFVRAWICTDDTQDSHLQVRVGDAISVKTLVQWSPGLPDLVRHPCGSFTCVSCANTKAWV